MKIRLHDGGGKTIAVFETDDLPHQNIWMERADGQQIGSLFFGGGGELVSLGQYDEDLCDWTARAVLRKTEDEISREHYSRR